MTTSDAAAGQVPATAAEIYDDFFVPALFGQWAGPLADAAELGEGQRVLDLPCGTGARTREAARRAGGEGRVTGLDLNAGMLSVARRKAPGIDWVEGRAEALPFGEAAFDAVLCQFGLMFFADRVAALREMARVARPGGRIALSVWDRAEASPGYAAMIGLIGEMFGPEAADALRAPFLLGDRDALRALLDEAGLGAVEVRTEAGTARFASVREWVRMDVRGWTLGAFIDDAGFEALAERAGQEMARFAGPDGRVAFAAPAHVVTATV